MIKINGKNFDSNSIKLSDYLSENKINHHWVAVEINEEILPKEQYDTAILKNGDVVEIVNFVGGGK
jgi:sulfur carrier protein